MRLDQREFACCKSDSTSTNGHPLERVVRSLPASRQHTSRLDQWILNHDFRGKLDQDRQQVLHCRNGKRCIQETNLRNLDDS